MRVIVLGADGYLGWPTAMAFSKDGHQVTAVDNFSKRMWEMEEGIRPLRHVSTLHKRIEVWRDISGNEIALRIGDLRNHRFVYNLIEEFLPDAIVHFAEQPSAPYSMQSRHNAVFTQHNNVLGNLNLLFAIKKHCPDSHLIKLGTMGEYGTPNVDIEEGWLDLTHNGRTERVLYPKKPGSFYHLSKVHDSNNIEFACRVWNLRCTDLNQGAVYGLTTECTELHSDLCTSFHYDSIFGTVLNRFAVQAVMGIPLTVYGSGTQTRGFLNIIDTVKCIMLAANNPPLSGTFEVYNQFTEQFSVTELAELVKSTAETIGISASIRRIQNPRVEDEYHYYNAKHTKLLELGLSPTLLSDKVILKMLNEIQIHRSNVDCSHIIPSIQWNSNMS